MFFRGGERLIIEGNDIHRDYQRYNQITRGLYTSKIGEIAVQNVFRRSETVSTAAPKSIELSLWRVTDKNVDAPERGVDSSEFLITKPNGERISYVVVPRMNTDAKDPRPLEYTEEKDATFEDINDPRVIVIARTYKGVVAELAKDFTLENEEAIRTGYKILTDDEQERYSDFSNPLFLKIVTSQAVQLFEPNVYATIHPEQQTRFTYPYIDAISQLIMQDIQGKGGEVTADSSTLPEFETETVEDTSENVTPVALEPTEDNKVFFETNGHIEKVENPTELDLVNEMVRKPTYENVSVNPNDIQSTMVEDEMGLSQ